MKEAKKELIERTAQEFQKLNEENKMFVLGYMLGIQSEKERKESQPEEPKIAQLPPAYAGGAAGVNKEETANAAE